MQPTAITLYREKLECTKCRHTWRDVVRRGDRGHIVMQRGDCRIFVLDDIVYEVPLNLDELRNTLLSLGFKDFSPACPRCAATRVRVVRGILTRDAPAQPVHLPAIELTTEDFEQTASPKLTTTAITSLLRAQAQSI